jgi:hypothetical protein
MGEFFFLLQFQTGNYRRLELPVNSTRLINRAFSAPRRLSWKGTTVPLRRDYLLGLLTLLHCGESS